MSWLERLRQKSDREKKVIAFGIALVIAVVIAVLWILARIAVQGV